MKFDYFIGKINGEGFITLALDGSAEHGYYEMETACEDLCNLVVQKKKILLTKAPNPDSPIIRNAGEGLNELNASLEKIFGPGSFPAYNESQSKDYDFKGNIYVPFNENELLDLQMGFILKIKAKNFEDPFLYQPYAPF